MHDPDQSGSPGEAPQTGPAAGDVVLQVLVALTVLAAGLILGATLAGRTLLSPPALLVGVVFFLPYLYASLLIWAFALWCVAPRRAAMPVLLAVVLAVAVLVWGPGSVASDGDGQGEVAVVLSWNVQRLWGERDALDCVTRTIASYDPDVVTLMEVSAEDVDALSVLLGMECVHSDYLGTGSRSRGGLASCVRGGRWHLHSGRPSRFVDEEAWTYIFTEVERGGRVFNVLAVHLYPYAIGGDALRRGVRGLARGRPGDLVDLGRSGEQTFRAQGAQSSALLQRVSRFRDPTVVAGDFNSTRDAALHIALRRHLTDAWEVGGHGFGGTVRFLRFVPLRIDYVYVSDAFGVSDAEIPHCDCSDHQPVVARLVLRP